MAKILNKDPVTYERERDSFLRELHHFHETRGTPFKKAPRISGNEIDLYLLYVLVTAHGGWIKVNTRNEWSLLCEQFHLPTGCVNSGVGLKQIYLRYLDRYEKVHFLGEDGQQADDDDEDSRHRKWSARSLHSVPLTYNHHQHNVAESLREYNGLSADLYKPSNYDKLALSLLSPLPNEQDFAINVCTFLSNEGKHTLRLEKYPRLINILLAHAGVFDSPGTRQLFIEVYSRVRNYSINSFWSDVLHTKDVIDLTNERTFMKKPNTDLNTFSRRKFLEKEKEKKKLMKKSNEQSNDTQQMDTDNQQHDMNNDNNQVIEKPINEIDDNNTFIDQNQNSIKFEDEDMDLFCMGRTLGTQDPYGQRVLQIASILRNLSFTNDNATVLGKNRCFIRFVLLCINSRWSNLHQLGFDILGNISNEIILKDCGEKLTDCVLSCIANGINSNDRFIVISCLEVLNKISQLDTNEEIVTYGLTDNVYELICRFLALSDIALLVYTLECLYSLTSLGERPCTSIARVRGAIDTLVALVTVEAQSYGPKACILMRVVETVSTLSVPNTNTIGQKTTTVSTTVSTASVATVTTQAVTSTSLISSSSASTSASSLSSSTLSALSAATISVATATTTSPATSRPTTPATPSNANSKAANKANAEAANSLQQQHAHQQVIQENEQFALSWLRANFELSPGSRIEQEELYKKYLGCCMKIGRKGVIAPLHFPRCVRSVFGGTIGPNPMKGENTGTQFYEGIRVRSASTNSSHPSQISSSSSSTTTTTTTLNPSTSTTTINSTPVKVSVAHPHLSQALLATGSQTNQQHQQQQQQQQQQQLNQQSQLIKEESTRSGATSSSIIKSLLATKVTVSGDCMPSAAVTCVSTQNACVTNTTSIASSISANQLISNQVAQRQQQQRLLQQQLASGVQPAAPTATPASPSIVIKAPVNSKQKNVSNSTTQGRKIQRLNGAKIIVSNNIEKTEINDNDSQTQIPTSSTAVVSTMTDNHITTSVKVIRPLNTTNKFNQRIIPTPIADDSDSTNNSLASSSGIGGSRDCSGVGAEEENSLTSFEGILLNGAPSSIDIDAQDDGSSKDSSGISTKDKPLMLADLLERKVDKEPLMNGVLGKNSLNDKATDLIENHIKKVLKEPDIKIKQEPMDNNVIQPELSDNALIEPPRGMKRISTDSDDLDIKKPKYSNGTTSPEPTDCTTAESTLSSIKSELQDDDNDNEQVKVSSTAANLYAALAADCIEDETDLDDVTIKDEPIQQIIKEEPLTRTFINNQIEQVQTQQPQPQQLIVTAPRQIVVQQAIQANNQVLLQSGAQLKGRTNVSQPQVLLQQSPGGQLQYVVSGGVPGQNYVLAQSQTALVQGQAQTVLVAQTTQQQGTGAKTIIILQPQSTSQQASQKVVAMTQQGQQVVVTQMPRPLLQSSALGNIPPPLVPTSGGIHQQASIIVNSSVSQNNQGTVTVTIPTVAQQCPITSSVPSRVVTPTPASTPPPTRPTTPHQAAATHGIIKQGAVKIVKAVSTSTSTEIDNKPSTSSHINSDCKTFTIKIDPNAYLCEWRGCLKQFKTAHEVYLHVCEAHCPSGPEEILCLWASCDGLKRRRFSLMTHLYDRHCNADSMNHRRKQLTATGKTEVSTTSATPHHPGYAPNAAFHAIKRHALEFVNPKELMQRPSKPAATIASSSSPRPGQNPPPEQDDNEGPVTKSIRLTAALILRNLVIYSTHGRRHLRAYEPHLAGVALSNVESSRTIAQVLYDMNDQSSSNR